MTSDWDNPRPPPVDASADINRDTITRFLMRAIAHASAVAVDAEFGLRVLNVGPSDVGSLCIDLADGHSVTIGFTHSLPRQPAEGVHP